MSGSELLISAELGLVYSLVALGIFLTFRIINFTDLTCDGSFVLGAAVCATLLHAGLNPALALLAAALSGMFAGLFTALLNRALGVSDLLSGILVAFMLYSINLKVMGGLPNITLFDTPTLFSNISPFLVLFGIGLVLFAGLCLLLLTDFGLALRSVGQNKQLSANYGVPVGFMIFFTLGLSNALIAASGGLLAQLQEFTDISQGVGTVVIGLAAVMLGERLIPFRSIWAAVGACFIGSLLYRLFIGLALHIQWLGLETQDLNLITGLMMLFILLSAKYKRRTDVRAV